MLAKIGIAVIAVLLCAAGFVALQPAAYRVSRSTQIAAPPATVHALINDFHHWDGWSPWAKLDPNMKTTYSGNPAGVGAVYHWSSTSDEVGEGRMTITESTPEKHVALNLEFIKPFQSNAVTNFHIQPAGTGSSVDWVMTGESDFMSKAVMLAMGGMDKAIGADFEKGLAQMKALAEKRQ